jgi:hypothetical protein
MKLNFLALLFLLFSCNKDRSCEGCDNNTCFKDATILYTGPVAGDGCDWVIRIGTNQLYHPDLLAEEFKENELPIKLCYELTTDEFRCGIRASVMPVIHVVKIKK